MEKESCFQLGYITRKHGLQGEVSVFLDVDFPEDYTNLDSVFLAAPSNDTLIPYFIESIQILENKAVIKFEGIDNADEAESLKSSQLFLPLDLLPELEENQFYYHEVIGYKIVDQNKGPLGVVKQIYEVPSHDLIGMEYQNKEVLVPVKDEIILRVDKKQKLLEVHLPEGLLELYL